MTPFGQKIRALRAARSLSLKQMAGDLQLSSAYLSALEHGWRGVPSPMLVRQICAYFGIIWDEAEELERLATLSDPRVSIDTGGLSPKATLVANRLATQIGTLNENQLDDLLRLLDAK